MHFIFAVSAASLTWFIAAAALFFNPFVDRIYRSQEGHPAVRTLPQNPRTIAMILAAVIVQCVAWVYVYTLVEDALPDALMSKGLVFGLILTLTKILPRDVDRLLLTTYPGGRMTIEAVVGVVCAFIVGLVFAYML